jgi:hypothetical protein
MLRIKITDETVFALIMNPRTDGEAGLDFNMVIGDEAFTKEGLCQYIDEGLKKDNEMAQRLLEIIVTVVEQIKEDWPEIAAAIRKMHIEHLKNQANEKEE